MFTREIDAYIDVIQSGELNDLQAQDLQEAGFIAVEQSNLTEDEKTKALEALGVDMPTKLVCVLQRLPSKRLSVFLKHGIDIGSKFDFVESFLNSKKGARYVG